MNNLIKYSWKMLCIAIFTGGIIRFHAIEIRPWYEYMIYGLYWIMLIKCYADMDKFIDNLE